MISMTLASLGWGTWWVMLFLHRFAPSLEPGLTAPNAISTLFAIPGLLLALATLRARRSWIAFALVPLFANASLLLVPTLAAELF
ncbi:MAG: hypothetical protein CMJ89_06620 [Planctomycetes bacterium]|jgi:hypothetical protein|nr:hypothetical protein [Planctomycetota bacterium]